MKSGSIHVLIGYAAPYRRTLSVSMAIMVVESAMALAVPWLGGRLAEGFLNQADTGTILLSLLVLLGAQAGLKAANNLILGRSAARILADLRVRVYDHLQALPIGFHHQRKQGETLALLTHDVDRLSGFISGTLLSVVPLFITVAGALIFMFAIDPWLSLTAAMLVPLFYLILKVIGRRLRPLSSQFQQAYAQMIGTAEENLGMLPAIKTFTREPLESARFNQQVDEIVSLNDKQLRIYAALGPGIQFLAAVGIVLVLWLAGERLNLGSIAPGQLVTFLLYATLLTRPVSALSDVYGQTQAARGALQRLMSVLGEAPEPFSRTGHELSGVRGEIEFKQVCFAYPGRAAVLDSVNLHIRAGETVALTGRNGAGKSTLGHLLMRLYEPGSGQILLDGINIKEIALPSLRRHIGVVPQHVLLFNGTVRDNIAYARENASQPEIETAARAARAHDFILSLPQGYDTVIGDRGIRLSGGQQQRLALARALLKDPPVLILDEATAMFDPEGEAEFLHECHDVLKRRTVLLITHRPASLALADRVVQLAEGGVKMD